MSITDELREWAEGDTLRAGMSLRTAHDQALAIADRIDAEHERATAGCIHYDPAQHYCAVHGDTEHGWVRLPVDADGKVIRVGDKLDGYGETTVVRRLTLGDDGWSMTCENGLWFDFAAFTHHHEPTVEEVMQEMLEKAVGYSDAHTTVALNTIAEYAEKLQLRED